MSVLSRANIPALKNGIETDLHFCCSAQVRAEIAAFLMVSSGCKSTPQVGPMAFNNLRIKN